MATETRVDTTTTFSNQKGQWSRLQHRGQNNEMQTNESFVNNEPLKTMATTSNQLLVSGLSPCLPSVSSGKDTVKHCLRTSTQVSEGEDKVGHEEQTFDAPLSPLQITLSQMCAMEDSQAFTEGGEEATMDLIGEVSTAKCSAAGVEDSGYVSREVSSVQSPSPHAKDKVDPSIDAKEMHDKSMKNIVVRGDLSAIDEEMLFAEVALEGLDDSLEELEDIDDEITPSHSLSRQKRPQAGSASDDQTPRVKEKSLQSRSLTNTKHSKPTTMSNHHNGVVKPQMGSLLSARLSNSRVSLEHTVGYRPPGRFSLAHLRSLGVIEDTLVVRSTNSAEFTFSGAQYFSSTVLRGGSVCIGDGAMLTLSSSGRAGVGEFWEAFRTLHSVDEKLISFEWFVNHYKQLVWKLASMEVSYPHLFGGRCLTPEWLMLQLKYRYDREIDQAERSALHKICESDDVPSKRMVLCVSRIYGENLVSGSETSRKCTDMESGNETVIQSENAKGSKPDTANCNPPCIEVTDGWYSLPCVLDEPLKQMVKRGKVTVGTKLVVYGAELIGQSNPTHPLEAPPTCSLKLSANSTRRARWFAKLGYQPIPCPFPIPMTSVYPDGGLVGSTDVVIARVYPLAYLEKREGKKSALRSERMEQKIAAIHDAERQRKIDSICSKVQKEFEEEVTKQGM